MITPEQAKEATIVAIESYLQQNKIKHTKNVSASGSIYYILELENGQPKIRVSNHNFRHDENYKLCSLSIVYTEDFGKNTTTKKIKIRVQKMIEKLIRSHNVYSIHKLLEKLDGGKIR